MAERRSKEYVDLPLAKLKPHSLQKEVYGERPNWQVQELAESMVRNGLDEPVKVLSDGTIICGHGRVEAAKRLRWKTVRCWVRRDLEEAGPEAVERRLIEANLHRRQLSRLDMVRSYRHLKKITRDKKGELPDEDKVKGDLRDLIAERFGVSGRTLDRWDQLLDLPLPIQQAVDEGRLPLTQAVKLARLERKTQETIATDLSSGKPVEEVLARHLDQTYAKVSDTELTAAVGASRALDRLLHALVKGCEELGPLVEDIQRIGAFNELKDLREGKKLIDAVIARIKRNQ